MLTIPDMAGSGRGMEEILQVLDSSQAFAGSRITHRGRRQRIGIPHPGEGQAAAVFRGVAGLPAGGALVEQVGRNKPLIVDNFPVLETVCQTKRAPELFNGSGQGNRTACPFWNVGCTGLVQEHPVKLIPGHTGAAVVVAEGQHIAIGPPGPLLIPAFFVVGLRIDARNAGPPRSIGV